MAELVLPCATVEERKGAVATIYSGDLPEFPEWFRHELESMLQRLQQEAREYAQNRNAPSPAR